MRILVTGAAGFIGSHLVTHLSADDEHEVFVVDDFSGGMGDRFKGLPVEPDHCFMADCRDFEAMDGIMEAVQPEVVFHLAANAAENKSQFSPVDITSRNYDAAIKTLTAAVRHGMKRFVFMSSAAVYGDVQGSHQFMPDEKTKPEPEDLYGISKLATEESIKVLADVHGFEYVILRPHNVFGPGQNMKDPYRNVVTIFMNSILRKEPCYLYGNGEMIRQFSFIDAVATASARCAALGGPVTNQTINIGSDYHISIKELLETIEFVSGEKVKRHLLPARPQEVKIVTVKHDKAKELLDYGENLDFQSQIKETWEWCKARGPQEVKHTSFEIESDKIPSNWKKR